MERMDTDLVQRLTTEGVHFEGSWSSFMFNMEEVLLLKKVTKEQVLAVLLAGTKFAGTGWSTGKASKKLFQLTGCALVKQTFEPYRDTWLFAIALITDVDLPSLELPQECADAAFAIAGCADGEVEMADPTPATPQGSDGDSREQDLLHFEWDEEEQTLPKELAALWGRALTGDQKIDIRRLLENHPKLSGIPSRAPDNNLLPDYRKKQDNFLKVVTQNLLNSLRILSYNWIRPVNSQVQLQLWQYLAELYVKSSS